MSALLITRRCNVGTTHSDHDDPNSRVKPIRFGNIDPELVGLDHGPTTFDSSTHVDGGAALSCSCLIV